MAKSNALTDKTIQAAKPKAKAYTLTDGRGLILLVNPNGSKLWRYKYGNGNKMALGIYPDVTLAMAREKHIDARRLLDSGIDPMAQRKEKKEAEKAKETGTFAIATKLWFEHWSEGRTPRHAKRVMQQLDKDVIPEFGKRQLAEIKPVHISDLARKIESRGAKQVARRNVKTIGMIFAYAVANGRIERNPVRDIEIKHVLKEAKTKKHVCVDKSKVGQLLRDIENSPLPIPRLAAKLLALTLVRTCELFQAPWSEFDFRARLWTIPAERMKMGKEHIVPLSRQAIALLMELREMAGDSKFVFPGQLGNEVIDDDTVRNLLERLGYKGLMTGHGFRTLGSTMLRENGFSKDHVEIQLAHVEGGVAGIYNDAEYMEPRIPMMQWYADHLDRVREGGEVINRRSAAEVIHAAKVISIVA